MLPYRTIKLEQFPDIGDIIGQGRASHVGRYAEPGGDYKNTNRSARDRRAIRRYLKRVDRRRSLREAFAEEA